MRTAVITRVASSYVRAVHHAGGDGQSSNLLPIVAFALPEFSGQDGRRLPPGSKSMLCVHSGRPAGRTAARHSQVRESARSVGRQAAGPADDYRVGGNLQVAPAGTLSLSHAVPTIWGGGEAGTNNEKTPAMARCSVQRGDHDCPGLSSLVELSTLTEISDLCSSNHTHH